MTDMPLEPDSPDDESHSSEIWHTDGGSHLEMIFDRTLWSASDIDLVRARLCTATDVTCEMFAWPPLEVGGLFCGDDRIRDLNRSFRGKDKPTNVLSFPAGEDMPSPGTLPPAHWRGKRYAIAFLQHITKGHYHRASTVFLILCC